MKSKGITRCVIVCLALLMIYGAFSIDVASAATNPPGCLGNLMDVGILRSPSTIVSGQTVNYTVIVNNNTQASGGCDVLGATVVLHCPAADGSPTGTVVPLHAGTVDFPADGSGNITYSNVPCVVTVNSNVTSATARAQANGCLQDTPATNDCSPFGTCVGGDCSDAGKNVSVNVLTCAVEVDKQVSCDGGTTWVDQGLVSSENAPGPSPECSALESQQIKVRYRVRNPGAADLLSCSLTESNTAFGTPQVSNELDLITTNVTTGFLPGEATPICSSADDEEPNNAVVQCICNTANSGVNVTANDRANFECLSCSAQVDKQISCDGGTTWVDQGLVSSENAPGPSPECSALAPQQIKARYVARNTGTAPLVSCSIGESNTTFGTGPVIGAIAPNTTIPNPIDATLTPICSSADDNEPNNAILSCICGNANSGVNVTANDRANFECTGTPGLSVTKVCAPQANEANAITITATNTGDLDLSNCVVTDTIYLTDPTCPSDPNTTPPGTGTVVTVSPQNFSIPATNPDTATTVSGSVPGLTANACNTVSVTCDVAATGGQITKVANDACEVPVVGACRMTGGHENQPGEANAAYTTSTTKVTTGGQIGAPNETGCCGPPTSNGRNSDCPWGDWEHNHHYGPDDTKTMSGGAFAFHSGTAASPEDAFIKNVKCDDPGWCVQARPAPFSQIFWEGTGVFHNLSKGNINVPLAKFNNCATQPVVWSQNKKTPATIHYYKAHVGDFGEPAGQRQKPATGCSLLREDDSSCKPGQLEDWEWGISCEALDNDCEVAATVNEAKTLLHPMCLAKDCSECPDWYDIEIHCGATADTPVAYKFSHFILEGNFQLHPPVGDTCNIICNGECQTGVLGYPQEHCSVDCDKEDCCPQ